MAGNSSQDTGVSGNGSFRGPPSIGFGPEVLITLYSIIFITAVLGNVLVIVTLIQNKRMRTVTNVLLLNLSISDLILVIFCMPSTLLGTLLRNFIFGPVLCPLLYYLQGVSVGVSAFTLVAIALERYFAICQPLQSRSWQTLSHAYKLIAVVWVLGALVSLPTPIYTRLVEIKGGAHKCMEMLPSLEAKIVYQLTLVVVLLIIPFILMVVAYGFISYTLYRGIRDGLGADESAPFNKQKKPVQGNSVDPHATQQNGRPNMTSQKTTASKRQKRNVDVSDMRRTQDVKARQSKIRVIKMLFAVVLEFFFCWTPSFFVSTWGLMDPSSRKYLSAFVVTLLHLISYISTCCNPITYAFMNVKFRTAFVQAFSCGRRGRGATTYGLTYRMAGRTNGTLTDNTASVTDTYG